MTLFRIFLFALIALQATAKVILVADSNELRSTIESAKAGDILELTGSVYPMESEIVIRSSEIEIRGASGSKPLIKLTIKGDYDKYSRILRADQVSDIKIRNLAFDGGYSAKEAVPESITKYENAPALIDFKRVQRIEISDCVIQNSWGIGMALGQIANQPVSQISIKRCEFKFVGNGHDISKNRDHRKQAIAFYVSGQDTKSISYDNYVGYNKFEDIGLDCVSMSRMRHSMVEHNVVRLNDAGSIYISRCQNITIYKNDVRNGRYGGNAIDVIDSDDIRIQGNTLWRNGAAGILLAGDCDFAFVVENHIYNNFRSSLTKTPSLHRGGITLSTDKTGAAPQNITISNNRAYNKEEISTTESQISGVYWYSQSGFDDFDNIAILDNNEFGRLSKTYKALKRSDGKGQFEHSGLSRSLKLDTQ